MYCNILCIRYVTTNNSVEHVGYLSFSPYPVLCIFSYRFTYKDILYICSFAIPDFEILVG